MNKNLICIPVETKQRSILLIRVQKVILDHDLAELYGVETKYMNRQVRLEKKIGTHDVAIQDIVATIRQRLLEVPSAVAGSDAKLSERIRKEISTALEDLSKAELPNDFSETETEKMDTDENDEN